MNRLTWGVWESSGVERWEFGICLIVLVLFVPSSAESIQYYLHSDSSGRITQFPRSDGGLSRTSLFTQRLSLRAYDMTDDQTDRLSAHLSVRYRNDLSLATGKSKESFYYSRWNRPSLEFGYLEYRPVDRFELRAGRQWIVGPLGFNDIDGVRTDLDVPIGEELTWNLALFGGRDLQIGFDRFTPDFFDRTGRPGRPDNGAGYHWLVGGTTGLRFSPETQLTFQYIRSIGTDQSVEGGQFDSTTTNSEQFGLSMVLNPLDEVMMSASGSYHTLLGKVDSLDASATWLAPLKFELTSGIDYAHPTFDSSSIFNLFGGYPNGRGYFGIGRNIEPLNTDVDVEIWARRHSIGSESRFEYQRGLSVSEKTDFDYLNRDFRLSTSFRYQQGQKKNNQFLSEAYVSGRRLLGEMTVRAYGSYLKNQSSSGRLYSGDSQTYGIALKQPILNLLHFPAGYVRLSGRHTIHSTAPNYTRLFASLSIEHWPGYE